jgi:hypothetical protein
MTSHLHLDLPAGSLPSVFQPKVLRAISSTHLIILGFIRLLATLMDLFGSEFTCCRIFSAKCHQNPPIQHSDLCGWPMRLFANEHLVFQSCCFLMHPIKWLIGLMNSNLLLVHPHASPTQRADSILQLLTKLYGVTGALRAQKYV